MYTMIVFNRVLYVRPYRTLPIHLGVIDVYDVDILWWIGKGIMLIHSIFCLC